MAFEKRYNNSKEERERSKGFGVKQVSRKEYEQQYRHKTFSELEKLKQTKEY